MSHLLEVKDLKVSYHSYAGEVQSVRGVNFTVDTGESVAIVGESGCGKSVTAKTIMGLIQTPPGEIKKESRILFEGKNLLEMSAKEWQAYRGSDCAIVFQDALAALNPTLTIGRQITEKIMIHTDMNKEAAMKEAERLLTLVGIPNPAKRLKQYPHEFSGGMRQRAMIAIALACQPKLLIADEPTTALDVTIQAEIIDLLKDLQKEFKMAVIMITHDLGIVADIATKIVVMYAGKVVETGSNYDVFYNPKHPYTQALFASVPDFKRKERKISLTGELPQYTDEFKGCVFHTRCPYACDKCRECAPKMKEVKPGHRVACHRIDG